MNIEFILLGFITLAALVTLVAIFGHWIVTATNRTIPIVVTILFFLLLISLMIVGVRNTFRQGYMMNGYPMMYPYLNGSTSAESEVAPEIGNPDPALAETYFVPTSTLPECFPVNGPWLDAFGKGLVYEIDPADPIFDQTTFNYFEGVVVPSEPGDLHSVFEMENKFTAEQGNVWTCSVVTDQKVKHTILFQSADKKWQNLEIQGLAHPMKVITPFGSWDYASGEKPAWALEADDTNLVCPFTTVSMSNPAGVILSDGSFVGAPGKAGCDFVAIYPDGQAVRYHDAIDNFPYPANTRFFLFDKKFTNEEVAKAINVATVTDSE